MRQYLSSLLVVLAMACGGTTDASNDGGAGSSAGGNGSSGHDQGGSAAAGVAGKATAGNVGTGGNVGTAGSVSVAGAGGTIIIGTAGVSTGGTGVVNPKCPAHVPMGMCSTEDAGTACQYESGSGCLCYPSAPGTFTLCQKVDPTCVYVPPGTGGVSAKIALPPREVCTCVGTTWNCTFGI